MTSTTDDKENFNRIMSGLTEVGEIMRGDAKPARVYVPAEIDVKAIRQRVGLSQDAFAAKFGFSAATLRQWEQGRRRPEASARLFLTVIDREPDAVLRALEPA